MSDAPGFNLSRIICLRDKLFNTVFLSHVHEIVEGSTLTDLIAQLRRGLPGRISENTLLETVRQLAGQELTPVLARTTAWRLAGNVPRLQAGLPVIPWHGQFQDEWVPVQIVRAVPCRTRKNEIGTAMTCRVQAGTPCPKSFTWVRTGRFWRRVSREMGFTNSRGRFFYKDAAQLVNLQVLFKLAAGPGETPRFTEIRCPQSAKSFNRKILLQRFHITPCPRGWIHPCHHCAIGYSECVSATHAKTYLEAFCQACGQNAPFDPEDSSDRCVTCTRQLRLKPRQSNESTK